MTDARIRGSAERTLAALVVYAAVVSVSTGCAADQKSGLRAERLTPIEPLRRCAQEQLDAFRGRVDAPGATLGFVLPDGRGGAVASGVSNKTGQMPMRPTDRMLAGSVGKVYVAAVMLQLLEEGRADLDTKLSHWFGDEEWFARLPNGESVTLRNLMNHSSGIPEHVWFREFLETVRAEPGRVWQPRELVAYVLDKDPLFPAGKGWSYSDTNYIFVGMIIERITGREYYDELIDRILEPLHLRDTIPSDRPDLPGLVSGYTSPQNPFGASEEVAVSGRYVAFNPQMEWTGGGLLSTSLDLARWAKLLYAGDVLKDKTKALMLQAVTAGPRLGPNHEYGLGVIIRPSEHGPVYGHGGFFPGYLSMMAYYPDLDVAVAIQFNTDTGVPSAAMEKLLDTVAGELVPAETETSREASVATE